MPRVKTLRGRTSCRAKASPGSGTGEWADSCLLRVCRALQEEGVAFFWVAPDGGQKPKSKVKSGKVPLSAWEDGGSGPRASPRPADCSRGDAQEHGFWSWRQMPRLGQKAGPGRVRPTQAGWGRAGATSVRSGGPPFFPPISCLPYGPPRQVSFGFSGLKGTRRAAPPLPLPPLSGYLGPWSIVSIFPPVTFQHVRTLSPAPGRPVGVRGGPGPPVGAPSQSAPAAPGLLRSQLTTRFLLHPNSRLLRANLKPVSPLWEQEWVKARPTQPNLPREPEFLAKGAPRFPVQLHSAQLLGGPAQELPVLLTHLLGLYRNPTSG
ncbi:basic proline-rich protein-like [Antechinus flavipes]|uniref:basic proline-rich protein-like n=1 Tax=Antechinus flavipes TaxID=38775 RepID=UPI0022365978|nr:basic proline-rich protein-like [Antechinus flavipes]